MSKTKINKHLFSARNAAHILDTSESLLSYMRKKKDGKPDWEKAPDGSFSYTGKALLEFRQLQLDEAKKLYELAVKRAEELISEQKEE